MSLEMIILKSKLERHMNKHLTLVIKENQNIGHYDVYFLGTKFDFQYDYKITTYENYKIIKNKLIQIIFDK